MTDDDIRKAYNEWWALQNVGDHSPRDAWLACAEKMGAELEASKEKERGSYELVRQANMKCDMMFKDLAQSSKREKRAVEFIKRMASSVDPLSGICEVCQTASCNHYDARIFLDYKLQGKEDQPTDEGVET